MWHPLPPERADILREAPQGLAAEEVERRRARFGSNDILAESGAGWRDLLRDTARDPMLWFLLAAALLFWMLGDRIEAMVLGVALLPIAGMDLYLHRRTQASRESLAGRLAAYAWAVRDGRRQHIAAIDLVPGDLVETAAAQSLPADGVLVEAEGLQIDESALTGESLPVRKRAFALAADAQAVPDESWVSAGTRVLAGRGRMLVLFTGAETLYGGLIRSVHAGDRTPLQQALSALVAMLLVAALVLCLGLAATRYAQGHGWLDALLSAVTLAVAALPEEFPVALAFFLGVGVYRLARRKALVRRAVAVENIGRTTCICSDKTGTLTEGRLHLEHLEPASGVTRSMLLEVAALASRESSEDPLDRAILEKVLTPTVKPVAVFPFTEDRLREVAVVSLADGHRAFMKGAPEAVLEMCDMGPEQRRQYLSRAAELASEGHKVIACADRIVTAWDGSEPVTGFLLIGLLAFEDPLRDGVVDAVRAAREAGIHVIMVTGDHPGAAGMIAAELGLGGGTPRVVLGNELESLDRIEAHSLDVVARCLPLQKLALVTALRREGECVAVTGDGVNDVPALQGADIGIAMGERGTRAAREAADIVLLDDNFRTIVAAIAEGRQLFANLRLCFAYLLVVHIPLVLTAALIPFAGFPLLYLPAHIVWLELVIHPTALLVFQAPADGGGLRMQRFESRLRFFDAGAWSLIGIFGLLSTLAVGAAFLVAQADGANAPQARGLALLILLGVAAGAALGLGGLRHRAAWVSAILTCASAVVVLQTPGLGALLHVAPQSTEAFALALLVLALSAALARRLVQRLAGS
ncbi:MAG TPA: cation-transporting P-type ATPase [Xanthomonadaceae bacterium]|nr:cation-transporting P-type ATPase [Xanthomonadaceae bacterium]